jgi:DNA-binding GntR family transcriptional regulator
MDLVTIEPYKGSRVRQVMQQDIQEAYLVRACLEEPAAQLAAPRFKGSVDRLRKEANAIHNAAHKKHVAEYAGHNIIVRL